MKKVLFPFEVNQPCYREAYVYAIKVARNLGAELIMLHAFEIEVDNTITHELYDQLKKKNWLIAHREILRFHDYYLNDHARLDNELRVRVDHRFINGKLLDEFKKIIQSEHIDLVVVPAGSNSESTRKNLRQMRKEVLNRGNLSLLGIPCESSFQNIDHILYVSELDSLKVTRNYLEEVAQFAQIFYSSVHVIDLARHSKENPEREAEVKRSLQFAKSLANRVFFKTIHERDPGASILDYISSSKINLIAMPRQQKHIIGGLFHSDTLAEMCSIFKIPVLILKDEATD